MSENAEPNTGNTPTTANAGATAPRREVAWRVFANEFNDSRIDFQESGERSPNYVVSPLGACMNRVMIMGVLTSCENVGEDFDTWRAQITDPTGVFHVYAGSYQPEAAEALSRIETPAVVAVVGKARTFRPEEGVVYVSIRPETITQVSVQERDQWILETADRTMDRVERLNAAMALEDPSIEDLEQRLAIHRSEATGLFRLLGEEQRPDVARYLRGVQEALSYVLPSTVAPPEPAPAPKAVMAAAAGGNGTVLEGTEPAAATDGTDAAEPEVDLTEAILAWVEDLDEGEGTSWEDLVQSVSQLGLEETELEEAVNDLMDQGRLYEPVLGRLKIA